MKPKEFTSKLDIVRRESEKERKSPRLFSSVTRGTKLLIIQIRTTSRGIGLRGKQFSFRHTVFMMWVSHLSRYICKSGVQR